ncbi:protein PHLOEM PROTEIN 2-LIKE A10-like [Diospyros lotus]|uniref:protein PHLOEM PROTEIN 2-LIKE A10-like n=1 Tax=Diospyros lotus TaxID=55363 RepID=UPI002259E3A5|nr:protein PHLOEM PROTEIN 2-LIKE A10-like [Diospyros lotus]
MDLALVKKGFDCTKRRRWVFALAALGCTGYCAYKVYHLPYVVKKKNRLLKLFGALISVVEATSDSAEVIGVVSRDLKKFVQSDSHQIPNSLRQFSKITESEELSESVIEVTKALTVGILSGYRSEARKGYGISANSSFLDQVLDKLFSVAGSGFASVAVGSFARNLVMALYSEAVSSGESNRKNSTSIALDDSKLNYAPEWVNDLSSEKSKELIGGCIQLFVSTAVAVYLDKTMHINPYDEIFSGLTNPKHEREVKEMLGSICNGAVETLIRTSNQVLTVNSNSSYPYLVINDDLGSQTTASEDLIGPATELIAAKSFDNEHGGWWANKISSTLEVPSNRKFLLDLTGIVTFETVRSFQDYLMEKMCDGMRSSFGVAHEAVVDKSDEVFRYMREKSAAIVTISIALCLHILGSPLILVPE